MLKFSSASQQCRLLTCSSYSSVCILLEEQFFLKKKTGYCYLRKVWVDDTTATEKLDWIVWGEGVWSAKLKTFFTGFPLYALIPTEWFHLIPPTVQWNRCCHLWIKLSNLTRFLWFLCPELKCDPRGCSHGLSIANHSYSRSCVFSLRKAMEIYSYRNIFIMKDN